MPNGIIPLDLTTVVAIIGAISGLISISALIYALGFKFGKIESTMGYIKPEAIGEMTAKLDILWKLYVEDRRQAISDELRVQILEMLTSMKNPHQVTVENLPFLAMSILRRLGINISNLEIRRVVPEEELHPRALTPIRDLRDLKPGVILFFTATIKIDDREATVFGTYALEHDMKLRLVSSEVEQVEIFAEEASNVEANIRARTKGYTKVFSELVPLVFGLILEAVHKPGD